MIVALKPDIFCTIVSEGNLNELYKKLEKAHENSLVEGGDKIEDNDFILCKDKEGSAWNRLREVWKLVTKNKSVDEKVSWYYKSAAIQQYYKSLFQTNGTDNNKLAWYYKNYPWETLVALRGEENIKELCEKLIQQKNIILTGAPGTGKTFLARKIALKLIGVKDLDNNPQYKFVQFHPSYDYTDFVEGLRPTTNGEDSSQNVSPTTNKEEIVFERKDGIFKEFCKNAAKAEKEDANGEQKKFVFVIDEINRGEISKIFGELFFSIDPGYRGEYSEGQDHISNRVRTQYQNLIDSNSSLTEDNYPFKTGFYVPNNVFVIGTMNDIDRSVESMDFAFRRRFAFYEISAVDSEAMIYAVEEKKDGNDTGWNYENKQDAVDRMESLNKAIVSKCGLSEQYQIGGAYFLKLKKVKFNFKRLWEEYLRGTLYEYFRGLPSKEIEDKLKILKDAYDNGAEN